MSQSKYRTQENRILDEQYLLDEDNEGCRRNISRLPDIEVIESNFDRQAYHLLLKIGVHYPDGIVLKQQDRTLTILCKYEERPVAGSWETCTVMRRLQIPDEAQMNKAYAWMSKNGMLSILAPIDIKTSEFNIPITFESLVGDAQSPPRAQMNAQRDLRQRRMQEAQYRMEAALRFQSTRNYNPSWGAAQLLCDGAMRQPNPRPINQLRQYNVQSLRRLYSYVPFHKVAIPLPYPRNANAVPPANNASLVVVCSTTEPQEGAAPLPVADANTGAPQQA